MQFPLCMQLEGVDGAEDAVWCTGALSCDRPCKPKLKMQKGRFAYETELTNYEKQEVCDLLRVVRTADALLQKLEG